MIYGLFGYALGLFFAQDHHYWVKVGDTAVIIQQQTNGTGKAFVHLHQNETTALKAAHAVVHTEGGSVLTLVHAGGRNIVFHLNKETYEFDPNRIFTDAGIQKTLTQFGECTIDAVSEVKRLADKIKALLPKGKII
ncbi:MAG TPA: protein tyrosine phosphatase, partial [Legionella sp.]|nr:protein tyrosine phosphatase [Legionella sp.]